MDHGEAYTTPVYGPGRGVVRFEGRTTAESLQGTSYNGGTYGAYVHIPCTVVERQS